MKTRGSVCDVILPTEPHLQCENVPLDVLLLPSLPSGLQTSPQKAALDAPPSRRPSPGCEQTSAVETSQLLPSSAPWSNHMMDVPSSFLPPSESCQKNHAWFHRHLHTTSITVGHCFSSASSSFFWILTFSIHPVLSAPSWEAPPGLHPPPDSEDSTPSSCL